MLKGYILYTSEDAAFDELEGLNGGVTVGPPGAPDLAVYNVKKGDVNIDIFG